MTKRKDEWIRVRSESELRAGMCVEVRQCQRCNKNERFFVSTKEDPRMCFRCNVASGVAFRFLGGCEDDTYYCPCRPIEEGRLYRLSDSQLTEDETTRELERVR